MAVFLEELGLTAYLTTWECPDDIGEIPADHAALLDYQIEHVVRLTDDEDGNARWTTWQALELHSTLHPHEIPLHPSSRPWRGLADAYYGAQGDRKTARTEVLRRQQQLETEAQEKLGLVWEGLGQGPRVQQQEGRAADAESGATNGDVVDDLDVCETIETDDGQELEVEEDPEEESSGEKSEDEQPELKESQQPKRAAAGQVDKRYRGSDKGPRCKSCRLSKKGCDGQQPCGRCEQAGRVCVPDT